MLTKTQIAEALQNSALISSLDINALQETLLQYPYCEPLRSLYLKALVDADDVRAEEMLQRSAVYLSNRRWLYDFLFGEADRLKPVDLESLTPTAGDYFGTVGKDEKDVSLKAMAQRLRELRKARKEQAAAEETSSEVSVVAVVTPTTDESVSLDEIKATIAAIVNPSEGVVESEQQPSTALSAESNEENSLPITEEMARQMIKEKRFLDALQILRRLIVENPEKSVYFAPQIRFVETIVDNLIN